MRTFKHFPKDTICKICGENDDKECILIPIDGTGKDNIREAMPIHADCLARIRYNKKINVFYIRGMEEVKQDEINKTEP